MTAMEDIDASSNSLQGTIPTEVGLMTAMVGL
jgi:hypothetical protein